MGSRIEKIGNIIIVVFIVLGLCSIILPTFERLHGLSPFFFIIGYISGGIFTLEYVLRILHARRSVGSRNAVRKYIFSWSGVIDFISILPFTIPYLLPIHSEETLLINAARVFLIFKLARYSSAFRTLGEVIMSVKKHLLTAMLIPLIFGSFSAVLIYYIEAEGGRFNDLLDCFYWAIITMATVGYGDMVPLTDVGKIIAGFTAMSGVLFIALPTGIISSAFTTRMKSDIVEHRTKSCRGSSRDGANFSPTTTSAFRRGQTGRFAFGYRRSR